MTNIGQLLHFSGSSPGGQPLNWRLTILYQPEYHDGPPAKLGLLRTVKQLVPLSRTRAACPKPPNRFVTWRSDSADTVSMLIRMDNVTPTPENVRPQSQEYLWNPNALLPFHSTVPCQFDNCGPTHPLFLERASCCWSSVSLCTVQQPLGSRWPSSSMTDQRALIGNSILAKRRHGLRNCRLSTFNMRSIRSSTSGSRGSSACTSFPGCLESGRLLQFRTGSRSYAY